MKKLTSAQRLARIKSLNEKLQRENSMLKSNYGVDPQMGVDEDSIRQAQEWKAQDAADEAMSQIPELGRRVGQALQPAMDEETPTQKMGNEYAMRMSRELEPRLRAAFDPIYPRHSRKWRM